MKWSIADVYAANVFTCESEQQRVYVTTACNTHMYSHTNSATNLIKGTKRACSGMCCVDVYFFLHATAVLLHAWCMHAKYFLGNIHG